MSFANSTPSLAASMAEKIVVAHHCVGCGPGEKCFGMEHWQLVPFWCLVLSLTLAYLVFKYAQECGTDCGKDKLLMSWWIKFVGKVAPSDLPASALEEGLLTKEKIRREPEVRLSTEQMTRVCENQEVASLATLFVLQHRRRFGNSTVSIVIGKDIRDLDLELETPSMTFAKLSTVVDAELTSLRKEPTKYNIPDAPEVMFAWGQATKKAGQWSIKQDGGFLNVRGHDCEEVETFQVLYESFAANPNMDVWAVGTMTDATEKKVRQWSIGDRKLGQFRVGKQTDGAMRPVIEVLREAPAIPTADAIVGDNFAISHQELWRRAGAMTNVVTKNARGSKSKFIIFYMGRGEMIGPSYFGVLQAGYSIVPVDVHWPGDRIQMVVQDTEAAMILTDDVNADAFDSLNLELNCPVIKVDLELMNQHASDAAPAMPTLNADSPALVLFTSGSTGRPKGIVLSHGYITALTADISEFKQMSTETKVMTASSPTWMPFLDALFAPLCKGGTCVLFPESATHVVRPDQLAEFARKTGATHSGFVPAMLEIFLEQGLPSTLAHVGVGGAPVPAELALRAKQALPHGGSLYTSYSGTEQGQPTVAIIRSEADVAMYTIPGRNLLDAGMAHGPQQIAILDQQLRPCGPGAIGEICVMGPGLCSGYLGMPEKTAETFVPCDYFGGKIAARTSDLGQWTEQGHLKIVGRKDSMVKVRGARVELGEVENCVNSHPDVKTCVVVVNKDRLVAYVSPAVPGTLRDHCKTKLVAYMVPHLFQSLEELPRLANGKINKKALPEPEDQADGAETVMELDSLGQMRKFTRRSAAEDLVLDNVRAILIGIVLQSHPIPMFPDSYAMKSANWDDLHAEWGPVQHAILWLLRSGGWSSLAFLSGFDDTRSERPYGFTYREPMFIALWFLCDFNWTMWYLPAFVIMRGFFCASHHLGLMKTHLILLSQIFLTMPAFVDLYTGWKPVDYSDGNPAGCFAPFQEWPSAQYILYHTVGWWNMGKEHSYLGIGLVFIPCYWLGFFLGPKIFPFLSRLAEEKNWFKRIAVALGVFWFYYFMSHVEAYSFTLYEDRCSQYWVGGTFHFEHIVRNVVYWCLNLWQSLMYVVFIAAAVPVHLKYLAKVCFSALLFSPFAECLMDFSTQALQIRSVMPEMISPGVEIAWIMVIPFLFELLVGHGFMLILPPIAKGIIALNAWIKKQLS
jgi:amino acid adenylation domain-containing protein